MEKILDTLRTIKEILEELVGVAAPFAALYIIYLLVACLHKYLES